MGFVSCLGHDIFFGGKHSMKFSATRSWGFDHQKETWEALPPMLSRRVGAAANTSAFLASLFPPSTAWRGFSSWGSCCGRMLLCLWWLGWTPVSASRNMEFKFHAWNLKKHKPSLDCFENGKLQLAFFNITTSQLDVFSFRFLFFRFLSASVSAKLCLLCSQASQFCWALQSYDGCMGSSTTYAREAIFWSLDAVKKTIIKSWDVLSLLMEWYCWGFKNLAITTREV